MAKLTLTNETHEYQIVAAFEPKVIETFPTYEACQKWASKNGVTGGQAYILKPGESKDYYIADRPGKILTAIGWLDF